MPTAPIPQTRAETLAAIARLTDPLNSQNTAQKMRDILAVLANSYFNRADDRITLAMLPPGIGIITPGGGGDFASLTGSPYDNAALADALNEFYQVVKVPVAQALADDLTVSAGAQYHITRAAGAGDIELFGLQGTDGGNGYFSPVGFWQNPATGKFEFASYDVPTDTVTPFGASIDTTDLVLKSNSIADNTLTGGVIVTNGSATTEVAPTYVRVTNGDGVVGQLLADRLYLGELAFIYDPNTGFSRVTGSRLQVSGYTPSFSADVTTEGRLASVVAVAQALDEKLANKNQPNGYLGLDSGGLIDISRLPLLPAGRRIVSAGGLADLTTTQQNQIGQGTVVTTTDGFRWIYSGTGSKTDGASYVQVADITPEWSAIAGKPTWGTGLVYDVGTNTYVLDFASTSDETTGTATQKVSTPAGRTSWWTNLKANVAQTFAQLLTLTGGLRIGSTGATITSTFNPADVSLAKRNAVVAAIAAAVTATSGAAFCLDSAAAVGGDPLTSADYVDRYFTDTRVTGTPYYYVCKLDADFSTGATTVKWFRIRPQ